MKTFHVLVLTLSLCIMGCNSDTKRNDIDPILAHWDLQETCVSPGDLSLICNPPEEVTTLQFFEDGGFELLIGSIQCDGFYETDEGDLGNEITLTSNEDNCTFGSNRFIITEISNSLLTLNWIGCREPCISYFKRR